MRDATSVCQGHWEQSSEWTARLGLEEESAVIYPDIQPRSRRAFFCCSAHASIECLPVTIANIFLPMATPQGGLDRIAGPASMARPDPSAGAAGGNSQDPSNPASSSAKPKKKKRGGKKHKRNRRQSFIAPSEAATEDTTDVGERPNLLEASHHASQRDSFYRVQSSAKNRSNTSLESEALLDHRDQAPVRSRRDTMRQGFARVTQPFRSHQHRPSDASGRKTGVASSRLAHAEGAAISEDDEEDTPSNERAPLLGARNGNHYKPDLSRNNSGLGGFAYGTPRSRRPTSRGSKASSRRGLEILTAARNAQLDGDHDVNNPPSVPNSPSMAVDDPFKHALGSSASDRGRDAVIDIDEDEMNSRFSASPQSMRRRATLAQIAERDVCFPGEDDMTEHGEESPHHSHRDNSAKPRRRRRRKFPDLEVLEEWSREEKEERTHQDLLRAKKISEPVMVGGRLRPAKTVWHREEDDSPFRFTYFNEALDGTIHARTISDLQDGMTFHELFHPDPVELSDSSSSEDEDNEAHQTSTERPALHPHRASSDGVLRESAILSESEQGRAPSIANSKFAAESAPASGHVTPRPKRKRYGPKPTWWLDVLSPTEQEMIVLCKTFGIHQLTSEDILMNEPREKVELFPSYYFINYRTFEQDKESKYYLDAINLYVVVFRDGVITFHHSMSPHPANVRRRIRQLNDYMSPTADWISYAIIDDITDVYAPLVADIEEEVDGIDEEILWMHTNAADDADQVGPKKDKKESKPKGSKDRDSRRGSDLNQADMGAAKAEGEKTAGESGGDMLRRVGECRKKVMSLYRLLGNKADVIKGFAKRCNEHWEVAPRSEIGLYLGDIQDHIVTMTGNLSHYER